MFDAMRTEGMGALMKFWNDPVMLKKLNEKLQIAPGGGAGGGMQPQEPVVDDLLSAARYVQTPDAIALNKHREATRII